MSRPLFPDDGLDGTEPEVGGVFEGAVAILAALRAALIDAGHVDPGCRYALAHPDHRCTRRDGSPLRGGICWHEARAQIHDGGMTIREAEIAADGGIGPVYRLIDLADPRGQ